VDLGSFVHAGGDARRKTVSTSVSRSFTITEELVRAYSRRGNYHSEPETSAELGLPGLVAQGLQVAGPAYAALLEAWGEDFLAHGELDMRFTGVVLAGDAIEARVDFEDNGAHASFEVTNVARGLVAVAGTARRASTRH
jgi:acyl dehydratase